MSDLSGLTIDSVFTASTNYVVPSSPKEKPIKSRTDVTAFLRKTPLMILEEGSKGTYQKNVTWHNQELTTTSTTEFEMTASLRGITVTGRGNSKKVAKQKAAVLYLHEAIKKGKRDDFFLPGATDEEAHGFIDQIAEKCEESKRSPIKLESQEAGGLEKDIPTISRIPDGAADQNFIGKLQERAQKMKLDAPLYEERQLETSRFAFYCTMCKQKTCGVNSTKKAAKNAAAYLMLELLEKGVDAIQAENFGDDFEELEAEEKGAAVRAQAFADQDKKTSLLNILSDKRRFSEYWMEFYYESLNTMANLDDMDSLSFSSESDEDNFFAEHKKEKKIVFGPGENFRKIPESTLTLLVKKVEENPCLWEIEHTDYKDTVKKDRIWWNIEKEMKILKVVKGATVKKVWIQLVTEFKKSKARISPSGSGFGEDEEEENFGFFNQMRFLEGSLAKKTPICLPTSSSGVARRKLEVSTPKRKKVFLEEDEDTPKTRAKKEEDPEMAKLDKLIDLCTTSMENRQNATKMQEHADITTIVLDTLRTLPPSQQFELKMEIGRCCEKFKVPRYQSLNNFNLDIHTFD